jgi:hypothetical protein
MASLVQRLVAAFEREGIASCHWKGAAALERGLRGERDLDLLVPPAAFVRAEGVLAATGFKAACSRFGGDVPGTAHFFGHEPALDRLLHVHLHDRVLTGEDLIASHTLPLAELFLASPARAHGVRVPTPAQEVLLSVLKHALRWGSLPDLALAVLAPKDERAALAALLTEENVAAAAALLASACPELDEATFRACAGALRAGRRSAALAVRVRRAFRPHANFGRLGRLAAYAQVAAARARRLLDGDRRDKALRGPGVAIAFVGGEPAARRAAAGETARWLGQAFALRVTRSSLVLVDGASGGNAVDLRIEVAGLDPASLRARVWSSL